MRDAIVAGAPVTLRTTRASQTGLPYVEQEYRPSSW